MRSVARPTRGRERCGHRIPQRTVRPTMIVLQAKMLRDHLGLLQTREPLTVEQLIAESTVERLIGAVLQGGSGLGVEHRVARSRPFCAQKMATIYYFVGSR